MKVLIVFSSHLGSDGRFWDRLTGFNTSRSVNCGGMLCVFNGEEYHGDGRWKVSALKDEIIKIIDKENDINEYAVLLHTQVDADLLELIEACNCINISIFKKFSTNDDLFKDFVQPLDLNSQESFSKLWRKLQEIEIAERTPEEGTKAHARKSAEYISDHNCSNVISYLSVPIGKLKGDITLDSKNAKNTILEFGKDFIKKYYNNSMSKFEQIVKVFPDNTEINEIPGKLAEANGKYADMYDKAERPDNNYNKVIVESGQMIIRLHQETIDILKKEVLQNGE